MLNIIIADTSKTNAPINAPAIVKITPLNSKEFTNLFTINVSGKNETT